MDHFFFGNKMICLIQKLHKRINIVWPFIQDFVWFFVRLEAYCTTWAINSSENNFRSDQIRQKFFSILKGNVKDMTLFYQYGGDEKTVEMRIDRNRKRWTTQQKKYVAESEIRLVRRLAAHPFHDKSAASCQQLHVSCLSRLFIHMLHANCFYNLQQVCK